MTSCEVGYKGGRERKSCATVLTAMSNVNVCVGYQTGGARGHAGRAGTLSKPSVTKQPQDQT